MIETPKKEIKIVKNYGGGGGGMVWFLGFIGALIYYMQSTNTFMEGVVAALKALVWPAFLIYRVLTVLKM